MKTKMPDGKSLIALARGIDPVETSVVDAMTKSPVVTEGPVSAAEAAPLMRRSHVRHLIVKQGDSDRILSIRDL